MSLTNVTGYCECPQYETDPNYVPLSSQKRPTERVLHVVVNSFGKWVIEKDGGSVPSSVIVPGQAYRPSGDASRRGSQDS
jgi:hypothetical protein